MVTTLAEQEIGTITAAPKDFKLIINKVSKNKKVKMPARLVKNVSEYGIASDSELNCFSGTSQTNWIIISKKLDFYF